VGLLLGAAVSWHMQSILLIPAAVLVIWFANREVAVSDRLRNMTWVLFLTAGVYAVWMALSVGAGLMSYVSLEGLAAELLTSHRGEFWLFTAGRS